MAIGHRSRSFDHAGIDEEPVENGRLRLLTLQAKNQLRQRSMICSLASNERSPRGFPNHAGDEASPQLRRLRKPLSGHRQ
jgi:hypothetical protein